MNASWGRIAALTGLFVAGGCVVVPDVVAQGVVSITPWAGIYVPTRNAFSTVGADIKRLNSFIGGARVTISGGTPFGVEFTAGQSPARTTIAGATLNGERETNVFLGSARLMIGMSPRSSPVGVHLGAGPAIIRRGRDVLRQDGSRTDLGGVLAVGVRLPFAPHLGFRLDVEDYVYHGDFDGTRRLQNDLVLSIGLSVSF